MKTNKLSPIDSDAMVLLYQNSKLSTTALGEMFGVTSGTVCRYLELAGVPRRSAGFRKGADHHAWAGGRIATSTGYVNVRVTRDDPLFCMATKKVDGASYVLEHRLVVARQLGRPLRRSETVHHIDGNKANNSRDNLQLRQGRHGKGVSFCCRTCGSNDVVPVALKD